jgi:hypothetical protein
MKEYKKKDWLPTWESTVANCKDELSKVPSEELAAIKKRREDFEAAYQATLICECAGHLEREEALFCPNCKQVMDKQLDPFYFKSFGECLDCRTVTETQMKIAGTWGNYTNQTFNLEIDQQIQEYKKWFESILQDTADGYVSENGEVQKWVGGIDKERAKQSLDEVIEYLTSLKK